MSNTTTQQHKAMETCSLQQQAIPNEQNLLKSNTEVSLWNELQSAKAEISNLQTVNAKLHQEISLLSQQVQALEKVVKVQNEPDQQIHYETDDDELTRETEWLVQKPKSKKRKASTTPENNNRKFAPAQIAAQIKQNISRVEKIEKRPPPINVVDFSDYNELYKLIYEVTKEAKITAMNNGIFKINPQTDTAYKLITERLRSNERKWYTYEDKHNRPLKVMARGLHHTCNPSEVVEELKTKGFKITEAINIMKHDRDPDNNKKTLKPLPLFMLVFESTEETSKVFEIKNILGLIVKIEAIRKKSTVIPQCKNCQSFGHTKGYCQKEPRCVKCAGKHMTANCAKANDRPPKCVNCGGEHPASYRGCEVAVALQKRRNLVIRENKNINGVQNKPNISHSNKPPGDNQEATTSRIQIVNKVNENEISRNTYADVAKKANQVKKTETKRQYSTDQLLKEILDKIKGQEKVNLAILQRINTLESGKKAANTK